MTEQEKLFKRDFRIFLRTEKNIKGFSLNSIIDAIDNQLPIVLKQCGKEMRYHLYEDAYSLLELQNFLNCLNNNENIMSVNHGYVSLVAIKHYIEFFCKIHQLEMVQEVTTQRFSEGEEENIRGIRYERNPEARKKCIDHYGCKCDVCGMDFEKTYGELGKGFIEVHHIIPISQRGGEYEVNSIEDLVPLCSNCHSMIHRTKGEPLSIEKLRSLLKKDL